MQKTFQEERFLHSFYIFRILVKFLPYINNALKYTVSNGPTEGINNKIKLIKRTSIIYVQEF